MPWLRLHHRQGIGDYVDNAIPVATQELIAQRADDIQQLSTSRSPFLSQPAALARLIRRLLAVTL
jgi:hypothetical protein